MAKPTPTAPHPKPLSLLRRVEPDWDKNPPPPPLPAEVAKATRRRYIEAYERITGRDFSSWPGVAQSQP